MAHVANKCRHLIGGLRRKLAVIHLFSNLIMVCIRPSKSHTVPALTMTHVAERFSSEGDLKNSSGGGEFISDGFFSFSPPMLEKHNLFSHERRRSQRCV